LAVIDVLEILWVTSAILILLSLFMFKSSSMIVEDTDFRFNLVW